MILSSNNSNERTGEPTSWRMIDGAHNAGLAKASGVLPRQYETDEEVVLRDATKFIRFTVQLSSHRRGDSYSTSHEMIVVHLLFLTAQIKHSFRKISTYVEELVIVFTHVAAASKAHPLAIMDIPRPDSGLGVAPLPSEPVPSRPRVRLPTRPKPCLIPSDPFTSCSRNLDTTFVHRCLLAQHPPIGRLPPPPEVSDMVRSWQPDEELEITVGVKEWQKSYRLPACILHSNSAPFGKLLGPRWMLVKRSIQLEDVSADVFEMFVDWLKYGRLVKSEGAITMVKCRRCLGMWSDFDSDLLFELYFFVNEYLIDNLRFAIAEEMLRLYASTHTLPEPEAMTAAQEFGAKDPLRLALNAIFVAAYQHREWRRDFKSPLSVVRSDLMPRRPTRGRHDQHAYEPWMQEVLVLIGQGLEETMTLTARNEQETMIADYVEDVVEIIEERNGKDGCACGDMDPERIRLGDPGRLQSLNGGAADVAI